MYQHENLLNNSAINTYLRIYSSDYKYSVSSLSECCYYMRTCELIKSEIASFNIRLEREKYLTQLKNWLQIKPETNDFGQP